MNSFHDSLYSVYQGFKTAKELWESLDCKYKSEVAGAKKFLVGRFLDFKMVDSRTVMSQVQKFQVLLHEIQAEGMALSESFQGAVVIEKLPPGWKDFKNYLKHKRKEMTMEDFVVKLRIEEDNKNFGKDLILPVAKVNVMEQGQSSKNKKGKKKLGMNRGIFKPKFQGKCFNCDKKEVNLIGSNPKEWWLDTGATRHVCSNRDLFTMLEPVTGERIYMGNSAHSAVEGKIDKVTLSND
ncbi:hypothetical protein CRG98_043350 [Punica granatum]|uniref:Retrovirus-related Pol polyprotein from transposon TNT 1-94-like beta-barrel domain-containing protein n=1 Tax=Punica granatum TaxID=22663 RepID=A0A2I0HX06_PUNGR|nr:hypothetical protein CRG98_043350 [Punica granatum]